MLRSTGGDVTDIQIEPDATWQVCVVEATGVSDDPAPANVSEGAQHIGVSMLHCKASVYNDMFCRARSGRAHV